jgi:hypothetical protein
MKGAQTQQQPQQPPAQGMSPQQDPNDGFGVFNQAHWGLGQGFNGAQGPLGMGSSSAYPQNNNLDTNSLLSSMQPGSMLGQSPGATKMPQ